MPATGHSVGKGDGDGKGDRGQGDVVDSGSSVTNCSRLFGISIGSENGSGGSDGGSDRGGSFSLVGPMAKLAVEGAGRAVTDAVSDCGERKRS